MTLRQQFKLVRHGILEDVRKSSAILVAKHFVASDAFKQSTHIACYFSTKDELSTDVVFTSLWRAGKSCYLPVLHEKVHSMGFAHYARSTVLCQNRYRIFEPKEPRYVDHDLLDIVLVPLLAFDKKGSRLGLGGGYYDQSFNFLLSVKRPAKPLLVGLCFSQQEAASIPRDSWDVPLDAVITEEGIRWFHSDS